MKKITLMAALAAMAITSCIKEEAPQTEMQSIVIRASIEAEGPQTKTGLDANGKLHWTTGDAISVWNSWENGGTFMKFTLTNGAGTANATFTGTKVGELTDYALLPFSTNHSYQDASLMFDLPTTYNYSEKCTEYGYSPMLAQFEKGKTDFYFQHLGGVFVYTLKNIPADATYFKFEVNERIRKYLNKKL